LVVVVRRLSHPNEVRPVSASANRELVDKYFDAVVAYVERDDSGPFREIVDPDVLLWLPESLGQRHGVDVPLQGIDALLRLVALARTRYTKMTSDVKLVVADDDGVAAWIEMSTPRRDGRGIYVNRYAWLWRVVDGKIVEIFEQPDSAKSLEAFGRD
jgi:ketosteroid isomerase-like protein